VKPQTKEVVIPAEIAKTGRREVILNLEDNFWAWWAHYGREDLLRPSNLDPRWKRIRILAATPERKSADELARLPIKTLLARAESQRLLQRWPWNARRRTFCTYHVAKHQSAAKTSLILRHRGSPESLFAVHKSAVGRCESEDMEQQVGVVGIGIYEVLRHRILESVVMMRALNHVFIEPDRRRTDFLLDGAIGG